MADVSELGEINDPVTALAQGKRHLLVQDFEKAVNALSQACNLFSEKYGDLSDELGEPYLLYGRALLSLAREESGVLGEAVPGNEETEDDNEEEDDEEENEEGKIEEDTNGRCSRITEEGDDVEDDGNSSSNLQSAWEVLELSKLILKERGALGFKLLAEAYRLLGEVAMESGNFQIALNDFQNSFDLMKKFEPVETRALAELHYHLGLAHSMDNNFDSSIREFEKASSLLEGRIKELESTTEPPKTNDPFYSVEGEIQELKDLLPEIQEKIIDMKDFKQEAYKMVIEGIKNHNCSNGAGPSGSSSSSSSSSTETKKPTSDISHLVRKKRKSDEESSDKVPTKKSSSD